MKLKLISALINVVALNLFLIILPQSAFMGFAGESIRVHDGDGLRKALMMAQPGDVIEVAQGSIDLKGAVVVQIKGGAHKPVVIRAARRGKVEFVGDSHFLLDGASHIKIDGFVFSSADGPAVEMRGCDNIRLTRNVFHLKETKRSSWVMVTGSKARPGLRSRNNRIDHNLFEKKSQLGNFITVEGTHTDSFYVSQYDTIDYNHFKDIGPRVENVLEAIRIGSSDFSLSSGFALIEKNLFERCDGDPEYISIKASDNIIRNNTFRECLGSLSLRHGNRNVVEGNYILGNGRTGTFTDSTGKQWTLGTGGIRFYGTGMKIINNYCEGLTGTKWDATVAITNGDAEYGDGQPLTKHFRLRDAVIAFNTFVNNKSSIEIGYNGEGFQGNWWRMAPVNLTIANNIIVGANDTLITFFTPPENATWEGNIMYATGTTVESRFTTTGLRIENPRLVKRDGMFRLSHNSPAIDAAAGSYPFVIKDVEGQPRYGKKDIGADEFSAARKTNQPLTSTDVGPKAK